MQNGEITVTLPTPVWLDGAEVHKFEVDIVSGHGAMLRVYFTGNGAMPVYESDEFVDQFYTMLRTLSSDLPDELREIEVAVDWVSMDEQAYIAGWKGPNNEELIYETSPELMYTALDTSSSTGPREGEYFAALPGAICTHNPG